MPQSQLLEQIVQTQTGHSWLLLDEVGGSLRVLGVNQKPLSLGESVLWGNNPPQKNQYHWTESQRKGSEELWHQQQLTQLCYSYATGTARVLQEVAPRKRMRPPLPVLPKETQACDGKGHFT